jgi:hypothetical protein
MMVPVLVTHGRLDTVVLPAMAEYVLSHCQAAEASWYEGVGHAPFLMNRCTSTLSLYVSVRVHTTEQWPHREIIMNDWTS